MKYLITESQIDRLIFKYLDNQDFIQIKRGDNIFFVNSEDDKYAQIKYDKSDGWCYVYWKLIEVISNFFSLKQTETEQVIGRWVENTLQMRVTLTSGFPILHLRIVENTL
jgi:hypothetical protein